MRTSNWISFLFFIILTGNSLIVIGLSSETGENRESRKLFGGYRITPKFCKASKTLPSSDHRSHGPTICMFNHECTQRQGEVVGACMDGFLFGTCCQLPGSVVTPLGSSADNYNPSSSKPAAALSYEAYGNQQSGSDYFNGLYGDDLVSKERPSSTNFGSTQQVTYTTNSGYYDNSAIEVDSNVNVGNPSNNILITNSYNNDPSNENSESVSVSSPSSNEFNGDRISSYFPISSTTSGTVTKGEMYLPPNVGAVQEFSPELPTLISNYQGGFSEDVSISTEPNRDFTAAGISHITNTLLNDNRPDFSNPESDIIDSNEKEINSYPTPSFSSTERIDDTTTPRVVKVTYGKPQFKPKPKPTKISSTLADKYVLVHTISNDKQTVGPNKPDATISDNDIESIESIILMLNDTKNRPQYTTGSNTETTSYNSATPTYGTRRPVQSTTSNNYSPTSFYITTKLPSSSLATKKPSTNYLYNSTPTRRPVTQPISYGGNDDDDDDNDNNYTLISSTTNSIKFPSSTLQPPSTNYLYSSTPTKRPADTVIITSSTYGSQTSSTKKPSTNYFYNSTPITKRPTTYTDEIVITPSTKKPTTNKATRRPTSGSATKRPPVHSTTYATTKPKPIKVSTPKPPSTSFVYSTQPTKRPGVTVTIQPNKKVTATYTTSRPSEQTIYSQGIYSNDFASTTDKNQILYNGQYPVHTVNENGYGQVSLGTDRPIPTIHITPKPTVNLITASSWTQRPTINKYTTPDKPPSNSYIYSSLPITNRPGAAYYSTTPNYPPLPNNDFDDSGYFGVTIRPTVEHTVTQTSVYTVVEKEPINSYGQPISSSTYGDQIIYQSTPSYPAFSQFSTIKDEFQTSPDNLINFPPVRNPNLNISGNYGGLSEEEISTPSFMEDEALDDKMSVLVNKIVASLQGNFDNLADMVYDRNSSGIEIEPQPITSSQRPTKKPTIVTTKRPTRVTTKRPINTRPAATSSTVRPSKKPLNDVTTKKPVRKPSTTTKKPAKVSTTKRPTTRRPVTKPNKKITTTQSPYGGNDEEEEDEYVGEEVESEEDNTVSGESRLQCGVRPQVKSGRIVGGKSAVFGEWPWQVLVRESTWLGLFTKNKCGGVLISNTYVMTAAHCQPGFLASLVAVFGEFDISGELETKRSVTKNVKRVIVHRQYDAATFENDLALLELESPIHYDTHIVPICMPANDADFTGRMATVTGWGRLKYGGGVPSVLQEVQVPVIENTVCQDMFSTAGHTKKILNSFLCAGYANGQKDSCEGDSGGPLVLQRSDGRWELAGTVSHGIKCAAPYLPGVYMRTTFYKPWLESVTGVH